jgi:sterol desaturase/sphingolipid hydroxylase (fatty acid hydroxylase superfamily)
MPLAALLPDRPALLHFGLFAVLLAIESVQPRHVVPGGRWPHVRRHLGLNALNLVLYAMFSGLALTLDELRLRHSFGLFMWLPLPSLAQLGLGLLLLDLCDYSFHRLEHAVGFLWRFHRVHHSDPGLDVTTSLRTHPVSLSLSWIYMQAGLCLLGAPQALLVLYFGIGAFVSHWQHANVELLAWRHERIVAFLVNTPRVHRRRCGTACWGPTAARPPTTCALASKGSMGPSSKICSRSCAVQNIKKINHKNLMRYLSINL